MPLCWKTSYYIGLTSCRRSSSTSTPPSPKPPVWALKRLEISPFAGSCGTPTPNATLGGWTHPCRIQGCQPLYLPPQCSLWRYKASYILPYPPSLQHKPRVQQETKHSREEPDSELEVAAATPLGESHPQDLITTRHPTQVDET